MTEFDTRGGRLRMPRSRGATSGFLLVLLGIWGALIPFVGPYFDFAFTPDQSWVWTTARGWLRCFRALPRRSAACCCWARETGPPRCWAGGWRYWPEPGSWSAAHWPSPLGIGDPRHADSCDRRQTGDAGAGLLLRAGRADRVPRRNGGGPVVGPQPA